MRDYLATQSRRIYNAFFFSVDGYRAMLREDPPVQQWIAFVLVFVPLGIWLGSDGVERAVLAGSVVMNLLLELINTAIETTIDRISMERHPLSKKAKDVGSAVVLSGLCLTIMVWALILFT